MGQNSPLAAFPTITLGGRKYSIDERSQVFRGSEETLAFHEQRAAPLLYEAFESELATGQSVQFAHAGIIPHLDKVDMQMHTFTIKEALLDEESAQRVYAVNEEAVLPERLRQHGPFFLRHELVKCDSAPGNAQE